MLRKRNASAATSTTEDTDEHSNGLSYGLPADGEAEDAEYDDESYDEDGEGEDYDEGAEGEYSEEEEYEDGDYDENAQYDEEGEYSDEEEYDEDDEEAEEHFTPPTAASALRRSWLSPRPRAQPASGTAEDGKKVNFLNRRETWIGYFLGVMLLALAVTSYFVDRHYVDKKNLTLQAEIHREAPWILVITLVLAAFILAATYFKRRAAVGFTLLLAGVALFNSDFLIGIIYLGTGLWLVFRSMRRNPKMATAGGGRAGVGRGRTGTTRAGPRASGRGRDAVETTSSSSAVNPPRVSSSATRTTSTGSSSRQIGRNGRLASSGQDSGRYTKPKASRYVPPKVQPEPEPTNRLSAWLKK